MPRHRASDGPSPALFGLSAIPDQVTYQAFTFLVFTYYFAVVGVPMALMWVAYVVWGIWNMINDPLLGTLSDRTRMRSRFGKRKLYIIASIVPLSVSMILLFTVPPVAAFAYFIFVIILFEGVYTMYSVNVNALFPEMFPTEHDRARTNLWVKGLTIIALIVAFILPTLIISPMVPLETSTPEEIAAIPSMYILSGAIICVISLATGIIFTNYGIHEKPESDAEFQARPPFLKSMKVTLANKEFVKFVASNTLIWYIFGMLPTIFPLYSVHVIGIAENSLLSGIALMLAFLACIPFFQLHRVIGRRIGHRNALILTCIVWAGTLLPYMFLSTGMVEGLMIVTALQGFGLSGGLYHVDIIHGDIIDKDELDTGARRAGSYYGVNAFIHRVSIILTISSIALVFNGTGWSEYVPVTSDMGLVILGLKMLMFVFPAIALAGAVALLAWYRIHGKVLVDMRSALDARRQASQGA